MKVLIVSDIHDNLATLDKALALSRSCSAGAVISCGDTTNIDTVAALDGFGLPVYLIRGNCDNFTDRDLLAYGNIRYLGRFGVIEIDSHKIGICHEPFFIEKVIESAGEEECEFIFYGHTHKPWEEKMGGTRVMNPGTLSGMFTPATLAIWDTDSGDVSLKIVNQ